MPPLRSLQFVPGTDSAPLAETSQSAADAVVHDLEDSVAPADKERVRATVTDKLRETDAPRHGVRVNGVDTEFGIADVTHLATADVQPDLIVLPDVRSEHEVQIVSNRLGSHDADIDVIPLVERPEAIFDAEAIARASPRVVGLIFGSVDFTVNMGLSVMEEADVTLPRHMVSMAASAADVPAFDMPYLELEDTEGLRAEAEAARAMGYDGKLAVTDEQAAVVNDVFGYSDAEIEEAREIVARFDASEDYLIEHEGYVLDEPVISLLRERVRTADGRD